MKKFKLKTLTKVMAGVLALTLIGTLCALPRVSEASAQAYEQPFDFIIEDFYDRVDGSTVTYPLTQAIVYAKFSFLASYEYVNHNKTDAATKAVINGTKDVALVTYPSTENLALAASKGVELAIVPIVNDAFVFLISSDVPVTNLTTRQIKDIYTGKITNWNQIPGCSYDMEISAFQRNGASGSQAGMVTFMGDEAGDLIDAPEALSPSTMGLLIDEMAETPGSIGYTYYYYVTEQYSWLETTYEVNLVALDGVAPDETTISNGTYPQRVCYYSVYRANERQTNFAYRFTAYLLSTEAQNLAEFVGYVKLDPTQRVTLKYGNAAEKVYSTIPFSLKDLEEKTVSSDGLCQVIYNMDDDSYVIEYTDIVPSMFGADRNMYVDDALNAVYGLRLTSNIYDTRTRLDTALNSVVNGEKDVCFFCTDFINTLPHLETAFPDLVFRTIRCYEPDKVYIPEFSYVMATRKSDAADSFGNQLYDWLNTADVLWFSANDGSDSEVWKSKILTTPFVVPTADALGITRETIYNNDGSANGFSFRCWNTKWDGTGLSFYPGDTINSKSELYGATALYAMWDEWIADPLPFWFHANGGTVLNGGEIYTDMPLYPFTLPDAESIGIRRIDDGANYTFSHWNTNADGSGTSYYAGRVVSKPGDIEHDLYAIWVAVNPTPSPDISPTPANQSPTPPSGSPEPVSPTPTDVPHTGVSDNTPYVIPVAILLMVGLFATGITLVIKRSIGKQI